MMKVSTTNTISIATHFAEAVAAKDFPLIESLLDDDGEFQIQSKRLNTLEVNKKRFMQWFRPKLKKTEITKVDYDNCISCHFAGIVVLFNKGRFPREPKEDSEWTKTGILIQSKGAKIVQLKFCYVFLKTENQCVIERNGAEMRALVQSGLSFDEAYRIVKETETDA